MSPDLLQYSVTQGSSSAYKYVTADPLRSHELCSLKFQSMQKGRIHSNTKHFLTTLATLLLQMRSVRLIPEAQSLTDKMSWRNSPFA